ncbi:ferredoxin-NADP reductase [Arthrobacter ginsengisoli]|uniref:Ferredoxin-NADP reductase n=1 Tax=Arthrobacter ginsengisoli TaxID=1356565 RepID=A0ABU1UDL4_9MICC|nr:PDR/VanB family oxidoreductase [Arthrobacter ginsengisoli]MDR7083266.1 ferredoxin-NADP reductase [Arthrobacter ginsengisoli]
MDNTKPLSLLVREVRHEAEGVVSVAFVDSTGADLPKWHPGAHLEITLPSGLVRQYSLWSNPDDPQHYRVGVLREDLGRGGSKEIHDTGLVGRTLTVTGPRNRFELVDAPRYIFIAGGIGVTPLVPMLHRVARRSPAPDWSFHYGGRSRKSMAFIGVVDRLAQTADDSRVSFVAEDDDGILDLRGILSDADEQTAIYCCGPNGLISAVEKLCEELGLPGLHVERFGAAPVDESVVSAENTQFEVELAKTGTTVSVGSDESILESVRTVVAGVIPASCEEGFCGTCEVRILAGKADHRDQILTQAEQDANESMFICVSRAKSPRIVLDL